MVGEVEKLGSELQVRAFGGAEIFEQGEVQSVKTGAIELRRGAAQGRAIRLAYGGRDGRARKGRGVQPLVHVVRTSVFVLSGNEQSITAKPGSRGNNTRNGKGLAILERENPVGFPAAKHTVDDRSTICEEALSFADGQLVGAAEMRSEEHTSELQSRLHLVCRLLLEKKKNSEEKTPRIVVYSLVKQVIGLPRWDSMEHYRSDQIVLLVTGIVNIVGRLIVSREQWSRI